MGVSKKAEKYVGVCIERALSTPFWEFLALHYAQSCAHRSLALSTPFWEFLLELYPPPPPNAPIPFYSLLGVSGRALKPWCSSLRLSTPFWEFQHTYASRWYRVPYTLEKLSTPFWEFLVRVLFKIFLSLSLKAFMKVIGTFVIS